jgi:hypothetical protein
VSPNQARLADACPSLRSLFGRVRGRRDHWLSSWVPLVGLLILCASCAAPWPVSGLRPLHPEPRHDRGTGVPVAAEVDTLRPTLRWEAFPRAADLAALHARNLGEISSVTYEFRVWVSKGGQFDPPVYERNGLTQAEHTLEEPLRGSTEYRWSVRARFLLDGIPRVTQWAVHRLPDGTGPPQSLVYFRFRTPEPK